MSTSVSCTETAGFATGVMKIAPLSHILADLRGQQGSWPFQASQAWKRVSEKGPLVCPSFSKIHNDHFVRASQGHFSTGSEECAQSVRLSSSCLAQPRAGVRGGFDGKPTLLLFEASYKKRGLGEMAAQFEEVSRASV